MKKQSLMLLTLLLVAATILVAGVSGYTPQIVSSRQSATNAAYRDGLFVAKYDVEQGRTLHLSSARWSTAADRASFIAGYHEGLRQIGPESLARLSVAEVAAYRDGVNDGVLHRKNARPFQVEKTDNYRAANATERRAYTAGYQLGYYTQEGDVNSSPVLQAANQVAWK